MVTKIDNFWTSFGTILEPILEPKTHQKMKQKRNPFWTKKVARAASGSGQRRPTGGAPIATGSELIRAKRYRKPIGLLSTGILSIGNRKYWTTEYRHTGELLTTEYRHTEYYY